MSTERWDAGGLSDLFGEREGGVRDWLDEAGHALHQCQCGATVYDPGAVGRVVQKVFGPARANEIVDWANGLAERFGWRHQTAAAPEQGLHYCPHCDPHRRK
jgi:hypothetical protein